VHGERPRRVLRTLAEGTTIAVSRTPAFRPRASWSQCGDLAGTEKIEVDGVEWEGGGC
jgi:hypothetical protein